jgi:hypothetical protein
LQLEAALRERMHAVHSEVKKRLDYQVAVNNVHARFEREQAINYIIDGVRSSIGANQVIFLKGLFVILFLIIFKFVNFFLSKRRLSTLAWLSLRLYHRNTPVLSRWISFYLIFKSKKKIRKYETS